ncbi:MAG: hypothetical protein ABEJ76_01520 [Halanaeroarchaeum sp.]
MVVYSSLLVGLLTLLAGAHLYFRASDEVDRWTDEHGAGEASDDPATVDRAVRRNELMGAFMVVLGLALTTYGLVG